MTVGELLVALDALPRELPVVGFYDGGCAHAPITNVFLDTDYEEPLVHLIVDS